MRIAALFTTTLHAAAGLNVLRGAPAPTATTAATAGRPALLAADAPARSPFAFMQQLDTTEGTDIFDEFMAVDPETGISKPIGLEEKEKLYLDCLDAYYNEGGKQLLSEDDYQKLKLDLEFSTSRVTLFSKDEIKFMIANKRYRMGKPILSDDEYDTLRKKLKGEGSVVALHDEATCKLDTGICKVDLRVDNAKMRLLYFPGVAGGLILGCELSFWTLHIDPLLSIVLSAVPAYFFGKWFTENIFAQKPLVTQAPCPKCNALTTVYFGDFFSVKIDGVIAPKGPPEDVLEVKCATCSEKLTADRGAMILQTQGEGPKTSSTKFMPA